MTSISCLLHVYLEQTVQLPVGDAVKECSSSRASVHSKFGRFRRPYEESVSLGSCRDQKVVVLSKNEGDYLYQFYGRQFHKEG